MGREHKEKSRVKIRAQESTLEECHSIVLLSQITTNTNLLFSAITKSSLVSLGYKGAI